jgi:hypothetical protein
MPVKLVVVLHCQIAGHLRNWKLGCHPDCNICSRRKVVKKHTLKLFYCWVVQLRSPPAAYFYIPPKKNIPFWKTFKCVAFYTVGWSWRGQSLLVKTFVSRCKGLRLLVLFKVSETYVSSCNCRAVVKAVSQMRLVPYKEENFWTKLEKSDMRFSFLNQEQQKCYFHRAHLFTKNLRLPSLKGRGFNVFYKFSAPAALEVGIAQSVWRLGLSYNLGTGVQFSEGAEFVTSPQCPQRLWGTPNHLLKGLFR